MNRVIATCLALYVGIGIAQDQHKHVVVGTLTARSVKSIPMPSFGWYGNAQCDGSGNLYFNAVRRPNDSLILKLSQDGTFSFYTLSAEDAANTWYEAFRVSPDGKLWVLAHGMSEGIFLSAFGHDAAVSPSRTRLQTPTHVEIRNFMVLNNGHVLVQGYYDQEAPPARRGRSYFAEFDASGTLVRTIKGEPRTTDVLKDSIVAQGVDAPAAQSDDGLIYMLIGNEVKVLSPAGELLRTFSVKSADPSYTAYNIYASARTIAVTYLKNSIGRAEPQYALFNSDGTQLGVYAPEKDLGNNMICYANESFQFYRVRGGKVLLMNAQP